MAPQNHRMASIEHRPQERLADADGPPLASDSRLLDQLRHERQALKDRLEGDKRALRGLLDAHLLSEADFVAARAVNATMSGILRQRWDEFLAMSHSERLAALSGERLNGMHWQSLFQCNPFVFLPAWQRATHASHGSASEPRPAGGR